MCGIEFQIACAADQGGEQASLRGRSGRIVPAGNHQSRNVNARGLFGEVRVANGFAAGDVALRRRIENHAADGSDHLRRLRNESRREPALDGLRNNRGHATCANGGNASIPNLRIANVRGSIAEHEASEPLRGVSAEPDSHLTSHGKTAEMRARDFYGIHESKNIAAELLLRVGAGSDAGEAVAASVIAEDAKVAPQCGGLRLPHR